MYNSTPLEYRDAAERILRYYLVNKKMPAYVTVPQGKDQFKIEEYNDAILRVQKYINEKKSFPPAIRFGAASTPPAPVITPPADPNSACLTTTLQEGSTGQCVIYLQQKLQDYGFYPFKVDGSFGPETKKAVIAFQNATGHTPDGVCGPKTWSSVPGYVVPKPGVLQGDAWVLAEVRKRGTVNSMQDLRNVIAANGKYLYYYDQQQSQATTVNTFKANCADWTNDVVLPVARALGLRASGVHCQVRCLDGVWYGHYCAEINGVLCDGAGWAKGQAYGKLICNNGYNFLHYEGNYIP